MADIVIPNTFAPLTVVPSAQMNANFAEIATKFNTFAVRTDVARTMSADLLFTDNLYDIGKAGATRPRDGIFSRNVVAGGYMSGRMQGYTETVLTPAIAAGTLTLDLSSSSGSNVFRVSWGANITTLALSNVPVAGQLAQFTLILDQTGAFTIALPASFRPSDGAAHSFSAVAGKTDTLVAWSTDGGTKWTYSLASGATT